MFQDYLKSKMSPYKELPLASQVDPEDSNDKDSITWEDQWPKGKFARLRSRAISWLPWALHLLLLGLYVTLYVRTKISFGKDIGSPGMNSFLHAVRC